MIQPLSVELKDLNGTDGAANPGCGLRGIVFHTTAHSTKFRELSKVGHCTLTYINPGRVRSGQVAPQLTAVVVI